MVDTQLISNHSSAGDELQSAWGPYWNDPLVSVIIAIDSGNDPAVYFTDDAWESLSKTVIKSTTCRQLAVWFDKETPGDTGNLIHVVFHSDGDDQVNYQTVDITDGSLGTLRTIDSGVTITAAEEINRCAITKARGGNLIVAFDTGNEIECYRSVDDGLNWVDRADVFEGSGGLQDFVLLFPANTSDPQDVVALFHDVDDGVLAATMSAKVYDDNLNSWGETVINASTVAGLIHLNMAGVIRHNDGHLLVAFWTEFNASGADLQTYDLTVETVGGGGVGVNQQANVLSNSAESVQVDLWINQNNQEVRASYFKGGTWESTVDLFNKISSDGMDSWGSEQQYSEDAADDLRFLHSGRMVGPNGGRWMPCFYNDDNTAIWINKVNDVEVPEGPEVIHHRSLEAFSRP